MRYTPRQYAESFLESALGVKDKKAIQKIVNNFIKILKINNDYKYLPQILKNLEELINEKEKRIKVQCLSAHPLSTKEKQAIIEPLKASEISGIFLKPKEFAIFLNAGKPIT